MYQAAYLTCNFSLFEIVCETLADHFHSIINLQAGCSTMGLVFGVWYSILILLYKGAGAHDL